MKLRELILKNRSYRRFYQDSRIPRGNIMELIDLARNAASSKNLQFLKYIISNEEDECEAVFSQLKWAAYLEDGTPKESEKPAAYITILLDKNISQNPSVDAGIAAQSILLGAVEKGLGGCIIGSINKSELRKYFELEDHLEILNVIALGKPKEKIVIEEMKENSIRYWRDANQVHHVPKRSLKEIIINY